MLVFFSDVTHICRHSSFSWSNILLQIYYVRFFIIAINKEVLILALCDTYIRHGNSCCWNTYACGSNVAVMGYMYVYTSQVKRVVVTCHG